MGQEIVYCNSCGLRILESDLRHGRAAVLRGKNYCKDCMAAAGGTPEGVVPEPQAAKTSRIPKASAPGPATGRRSDQAARRAGDTGRIPKVTRSGFLPVDPAARIVFLVGAALLVVAVVVILLLMSRAQGPG